MGTIQQLEQYLLLKLAHGETIQQYTYGLYANEHTPSIFKSTTLIAATNVHVYLCTSFEDEIYCEELSYCDIQACYHRQRTLSGKETILITNKKRISISHIEEGCPVNFMKFVQKRMRTPFSTTA